MSAFISLNTVSAACLYRASITNSETPSSSLIGKSHPEKNGTLCKGGAN
jgi:hypothetical protein